MGDSSLLNTSCSFNRVFCKGGPKLCRINPDKNNKKKEIITNKPTSIERLPPSILAKSQKEVNKISKYFKPNKFTKTIPIKAKSYAQTVKNASNTKEVLKIKETFPSLQATNIDSTQKIIKGDNNPKHKPQINITTKGPLHKQVIVPISNNNRKNFMNVSSIHVSNMNSVMIQSSKC